MSPLPPPEAHHRAPLLSPAQAERSITTNLPPVDHLGDFVEAVGPYMLRMQLPFKA